jgi:hypothetical protein
MPGATISEPNKRIAEAPRSCLFTDRRPTPDLQRAVVRFLILLGWSRTNDFCRDADSFPDNASFARRGR